MVKREKMMMVSSEMEETKNGWNIIIKRSFIPLLWLSEFQGRNVTLLETSSGLETLAKKTKKQLTVKLAEKFSKL